MARDNRIRRKKVSSSSKKNSVPQRPLRIDSIYNDDYIDIDEIYANYYNQKKKNTNNTRSNKSNSRNSNKKSSVKNRGNKSRKKNKNLFLSILKPIISIFLVVILISTTIAGVFVYNTLKDQNIVDNEYLKSKYISTGVVSSEEIPQYVKDAVVSIEDERFYKHKGVDIISLARVALHNIIYKTSYGGSTIEMQISKNLLTNMDKTIERKIRDIYNAIKMDQSMTKDEILVTYLNNIYLGNSCYGVASGAKEYFGKDISDLTLAESAMLVGITNNPGKYKEFAKAKQRQEIILGKMKELGYITEKEYNKALREPVSFKSEIE